MSGDHDAGGDYGYDMAHEVSAALRTPPVAVRARFTGSFVAHRELDPDGDFGYDEAHDL